MAGGITLSKEIYNNDKTFATDAEQTNTNASSEISLSLETKLQFRIYCDHTQSDRQLDK